MMSGSLSHSPDRIIVALLINESAGTTPSDKGSWPVHRAVSPESPDALITVTGTASIKQGRFMPTGVTQEHFGVQIRVRAASHAAGWTKANAIKVILDAVLYNGVTIGTDGYTIYAISHNGIIDVGKEVPTSKRNVFTINALCAIREIL